MEWRLLVLDRHLALVCPLHRSNSDFHDRFKLIRRDLVHTFTTRHALGHHFWVEQHLPDPLTGCVESIIALDLQTIRPPNKVCAPAVDPA